MMEWQPMETAPKDGNVVWLCKRIDDHHWCYYIGSYLKYDDTSGDWHELEFGGKCNIIFAPTHWMPLPFPPKD